EPTDFALDGFEAVLLELEGVAIELLPGATQAAGHPLPAFFEPAAPALEDLQADVGVGLREKREPDAEALVLPGRRTVLGELVLQALLAFGGELVDDPAAP